MKAANIDIKLHDQYIYVHDEIQAGFAGLLEKLGVRENTILTACAKEQTDHVLAQSMPSIALVSLCPQSLDGIQVISEAASGQTPMAIIAAAHSDDPSVSAAAIRAGATDFLNLNLPDSAARLGRRIRRSLRMIAEQYKLKSSNHALFDETAVEFLGASQVMQDVSKLIVNAAKSNASVFITGENGTGKEVCAQLIHQLSTRNESDLVTLNCAAIPQGLAESELFGHIKGSFTGAVNDRIGVAKLADKGSLFLDEIGEMETGIQTKLLRFVQTGLFNPVGSSQQHDVDIRFICATNQDPAQQIADGSFRQDLFYRLNVIQIHLPPLRERGQDILDIAKRFLKQFNAEENKNFACFSPETEHLLLSYSWPGNIRELQNVIRNILVLHDGDAIIPSMLPLAIIREKGDRRRSRSRNNVDAEREEMLDKLRESVKLLSAKNDSNTAGLAANSEAIIPLDEVIQQSIINAVDACDGNVANAAQKLGVSTATLYRKLKNRS